MWIENASNGAVIAASRWEEIGNNPERVSKLKRFETDFDWSGVRFPVSFRDIKGFESRNQISINILVIEDRQVYICRKGGNYERIANLMLITENNRKHYVAIKSLSRLLFSQNTKHNGKEYFCTNCLQGFWEESSRNEHLGYCEDNESVRIEMPHRTPMVEYSDGQFQFKVLFIMYADFESILKPIQDLGNNPRISSTRVVNVHTPPGWCIRSEFAYGEVKDPLKLYRGKDCVLKFCDHIIGEARHLYRSLPEKPMEPITKAQLKDYKHMSSCHICFKSFREGNRKVRDHCHSLCNLQYKVPSYLLVVFHNFTGYDAHMFIKELAKSGSLIGIIAKSKGDYISFSVSVEVDKYIDKNGEERSKEVDLRFIDSFKFVSSSLDSLVNNLARGNNGFFGFEDYNESQYKLLIRKGTYPYGYMDDWDKFAETALPPKEAFYSKLNIVWS